MWRSQFRSRLFSQTRRAGARSRSFASAARCPSAIKSSVFATTGAISAVIVYSLWQEVVGFAEQQRPSTGITQSSDTVVESRSGASIPKWLSINGEPKQELVGTSVRTITVFSFLTYTFATYVQSGAMAGIFAKSEGNGLEKAKAALNTLVTNSTVPRTIRIVPYRTIDCTHFCQSLTTGITERRKRAGRDPGAVTVAASQFRSLFTSKDLVAGSTVDLAFSNSELRVFVNGVLLGSMKDVIWEQEFLGMFFGEPPRAANIRNDLAKAISQEYDV